MKNMAWEFQYGISLKAYEKGETDMNELISAAEVCFRQWFFRGVEISLLHCFVQDFV